MCYLLQQIKQIRCMTLTGIAMTGVSYEYGMRRQPPLVGASLSNKLVNYLPQLPNVVLPFCKWSQLDYSGCRLSARRVSSSPQVCVCRNQFCVSCCRPQPVGGSGWDWAEFSLFWESWMYQGHLQWTQVLSQISELALLSIVTFQSARWAQSCCFWS